MSAATCVATSDGQLVPMPGLIGQRLDTNGGPVVIDLSYPAREEPVRKTRQYTVQLDKHSIPISFLNTDGSVIFHNVYASYRQGADRDTTVLVEDRSASSDLLVSLLAIQQYELIPGSTLSRYVTTSVATYRKAGGRLIRDLGLTRLARRKVNHALISMPANSAIRVSVFQQSFKCGPRVHILEWDGADLQVYDENIYTLIEYGHKGQSPTLAQLLRDPGSGASHHRLRFAQSPASTPYHNPVTV